MSDYHILEQDKGQRGYTIAYHFPVAAGNNDAGRAWSACLVEYKTKNGASLTSQVPGITDQAALSAGTLMEVVQFFRFSSINLTGAQKKAEVENGNGSEKGWNAIKTDQQNELAIILENWTRGFNVP